MLNHLTKSPRESFLTGPGLLDAVWSGALILVFFVLVFAQVAEVFSHELGRSTVVAAVSVPSPTSLSDRPILRAPADPS